MKYGTNVTIINGNLTREPEVRYRSDGTAEAEFCVAINKPGGKGADGERQQDVVTFVDCEASGKQAQAVGEYLRKGSGVIVEGELKLNQWVDKQTGQKRAKLIVKAKNVSFLDKSSD